MLAGRQKQLAGSMSGGEQQMLAIARALMSEPRILLVDEPSVGLAPILVGRVIAKIKELKEKRDLSVLMAEQNFNQAVKIADRGYIIVHGRIEFRGPSAPPDRARPREEVLPRRVRSPKGNEPRAARAWTGPGARILARDDVGAAGRRCPARPCRRRGLRW